jgi:hypothetical protein
MYVHDARLVMPQKLTYIHERKRFVQQPERAIDGPIQPRIISTGTKSDEVLLVLDVLLFRVVQRVLVLNIVPHAAVFRLRRPIRREQFLCRVQECGCQRRQHHRHAGIVARDTTYHER